MPPYYALGIYTGSQLDPAWGTPAEIYKKIDAYIAAKVPVEGVVLDQYTTKNVCPFQANSSFDLSDMQSHLRNLDMKMYLSIQAGIQVGDLCAAYAAAEQKGCLLSQNGSDNKTVGVGKPFGANDTELYAMALLDVFNGSAVDCMSDLFEILMPSNSTI